MNAFFNRPLMTYVVVLSGLVSGGAAMGWGATVGFEVATGALIGIGNALTARWACLRWLRAPSHGSLASVAWVLSFKTFLMIGLLLVLIVGVGMDARWLGLGLGAWIASVLFASMHFMFGQPEKLVPTACASLGGD
jgi:hypothetical protein